MGPIDAAAIALADTINGLIELRICREAIEALRHFILVVECSGKPELVDPEFENPLENPDRQRA